MYVDIFHDRKTDKLKVAERVNGKRVEKELNPIYELYKQDNNGRYIALTGERCSKVTCKNSREFNLNKKLLKTRKIQTFESDVNIIFKSIAHYYHDLRFPELHKFFFDIETDFDEVNGYASSQDPWLPITMISYYCGWNGDHGAYVVKPNETPTYPEMSDEEADEIIEKFDNVVRCQTEVELLEKFVDKLFDADVLSGWNSEAFDIPFIINRVKRVAPHLFNKFCLWDLYPKEKEIEVFEKKVQTYDLIGRIHLDYQQLFKKHNGQELPSYKLDYVGELVCNENKVPYEGTLHQLYHEDFELFIEYGLQDSLLLKKIDDVKDYINLANIIAHQNTVLIPTTMGSVALIDTAIINETHNMGKIVFDKKYHESPDRKAAGAWVADPHVGLQEFIGLIDLNSLYPSTIRSLNLSTETIVGQVRLDYTNEQLDDRIKEQRIKSRSKKFKPDWTEAWHGFFGTVEFNLIKNSDDEKILTVDFEDGTQTTCTGKEFKERILNPNNPYVISANGTIFRRDVKGVIPQILERWYFERQLWQRARDHFIALVETGISPEEFSEVLHGISGYDWIMEHDPIEMEIIDGLYWAKDKTLSLSRSSYWGVQEYVKKILLNSTYGSLLNEGSRFYDPRLGQSVTLTGRCITQHMACKINELLVGKYTHIDGSAVYGDSVTGDTMIDLMDEDGNKFQKSIQSLFEESTSTFKGSEKQYATTKNKVLTYDQESNKAVYDDVQLVMKHKNEGARYQLSVDGKSVTTTSDHGIMIEVNGVMQCATPSEIENMINEGHEVFLLTRSTNEE